MEQMEMTKREWRMQRERRINGQIHIFLFSFILYYICYLNGVFFVDL